MGDQQAGPRGEGSCRQALDGRTSQASTDSSLLLRVLISTRRQHFQGPLVVENAGQVASGGCGRDRALRIVCGPCGTFRTSRSHLRPCASRRCVLFSTAPPPFHLMTLLASTSCNSSWYLLNIVRLLSNVALGIDGRLCGQYYSLKLEGTRQTILSFSRAFSLSVLSNLWLFDRIISLGVGSMHDDA